MAGLAKKAKGLQRFMLDCGFWQSPSWRGLRRVAEIGLMTAGVSYCNEHLTDGELPGPLDELASALGLQAKDVRKPLASFTTTGKWMEKDDNYTIVGYLDHNPSRIEVMDDRRRRATSATKANHERWHVEKGVTDPDCALCPSQNGSHLRSESDQATDVDHIPSEGTEGTEVSEPKDAKYAGPSSSSRSDLHPLTAIRSEEETPAWAILESERRLRDRDPGLPRIVNPAKWVKDVAREDVWPAYAATVATWGPLTDDEIGLRLARMASDPDHDQAERVAKLRQQRGA